MFSNAKLNQIIESMPAGPSKMHLVFLAALINSHLLGKSTAEDFANDVKVIFASSE